MTTSPSLPSDPAGSYDESPQRLEFKVPARASELSGLRQDVRHFAARAGMGSPQCAAVELAVAEACANVVTHAYVGRPEPGLLWLTAWTSRAELVIEIADRGKGLAPRPDSPGLGLGLPLISALASSVEFRAPPRGGTAVRMCFSVAELAETAWQRPG